MPASGCYGTGCKFRPHQMRSLEDNVRNAGLDPLRLPAALGGPMILGFPAKDRWNPTR